MSTETTLLFEELIRNGINATNHTSKMIAFSKLLEEVYNIKIEDLLPGIEKKIGSRILGLRGSIDLLFSYLVLEFKTDFKKEIEDAEIELQKYFQALLEKEPGKKYVGLVTDCKIFAAYMPSILGNTVIGVSMVGKPIDIMKMRSDDAILWLDSYLFSKRGQKMTAEDLSLRFGPNSLTYEIIRKDLEELFSQIKKEKEVDLKFKLWTKHMSVVYGKDPNESSFIDQTYLVTLVKVLIYLKLSNDKVITDDDLLNTPANPISSSVFFFTSSMH